MIKKISITLTFVCLLLIPFFSCIHFSQAQSSPTLNITPSTVTVPNTSEIFELAFKINGVKDLYAWAATIIWESQYLEMIGKPVQGNFFPDATSVFLTTVEHKQSDATGRVTATESSLLPDVPSGDGTLVIFKFKVLKPVISTTVNVTATQLFSIILDSRGVPLSNPDVNPYPAVTYATTTVSYIPSDGSPVAHAGSNQTINQFTNVLLDASQSLPQDVPDQTYTWTFIDNATRTLTGKTVNYTFDWPGVIPVTLTVTNSKGSSDAIIGITVICITPPVPVIDVEGHSGQTINVPANQRLYFNSSQSYAPYNMTLTSRIWDFGDSSNKISNHQTSYAYSAPGTYIVSLTVTNNAGLNATATKTIVVGDGVSTSLGSSSNDANNANRSSNQNGAQQNTLNLPPIILYPLIFVTVFAIGGAAFWLRKKNDAI
ncbi:MAG: PKD domain-containing protein [Candidatus Bathyarchaeota archaeon]|nr:PKD domain-containing protein [Candidatus Termiticorpusculum sp.]